MAVLYRDQGQPAHVPPTYGLHRDPQLLMPAVNSYWMSRATQVTWRVAAHCTERRNTVVLVRPLGRSTQELRLVLRDLYGVDARGATLWMPVAVADSVPPAVLPYLRSRQPSDLNPEAETYLSQLWRPQ